MAKPGWRRAAGLVEGRPAVIVHDRVSGQPVYFVLLTWRDGALVSIRDFRYARYVMATVLGAS